MFVEEKNIYVVHFIKPSSNMALAWVCPGVQGYLGAAHMERGSTRALKQNRQSRGDGKEGGRERTSGLGLQDL